MTAGPGPMITMRGIGTDTELTKQKVTPGTSRRILPYLKPYRATIAILLFVTVLTSLTAVAVPILFKVLIDDGIMKRDDAVVWGVAAAVAGLAVFEAVASWAESVFSGRISEGLIYDLRTRVFEHIQRQPIGFFTRAQTGALISRLNNDVMAAQSALTMLLTSVVSGALGLTLVLATMFTLSWQITLLALVVLPLFVLPGRIVGRRMQRLMRESMHLNAEMGSLMQERFNVSGALLAKLYGRPREESSLFRVRAGRVRDLGVVVNVYTRMLLIAMSLVASVATAVVYGVGGHLVVTGAFEIGTLVALATLLTRLFGPINQLSTVQANVMTALVSFDRLFELLDLKPLITERPGAADLPYATPGAARATPATSAPEIRFDNVSFRYPAAAEVSLASLESLALPAPERPHDSPVLRELSFTAPAGKLTALVGPSGAGKTTITYLVPRLYDAGSGTVSIGGTDVRDLTLDSLRNNVGMVTQDAHLFHETIGDNLRYARPDVSEREIVEACKAAQIWNVIASLPDGLNTVVGDRGYRLSGGEKQRIALARLLIKAPSIVVLDEATAHLDSESEAAVQLALKTALQGRTSLVIAHRLSTIREADQILVVEDGRIRERGVHEELLEAGGLYAELYRTQFSNGNARRAPAPVPHLVGPGGPQDGEFAPGDIPFDFLTPPPGGGAVFGPGPRRMAPGGPGGPGGRRLGPGGPGGPPPHEDPPVTRR